MIKFPTLIRIKVLARFSGQLLDQRFVPMGLTDTKMKILSALSYRSPLTATDLLPWTEVEKPSLTKLLESLAREGLIERQPHPTDKRATSLFITDAGRMVQKSAAEAVDQADKDLLSALTINEAEEFERLCGILFARFEELGIGFQKKEKSEGRGEDATTT